jgi:alkanesulfonate monooxygenase SsuD/methylene tetrahydromethanopterin reductase-like flavin-dependent oxidoreductase (luciferase family)
MPDYGHELVFGTFLSPHYDRPDEVIGLAKVTEQAGLDLVTFEDHPYELALLESWTLLTLAATETQRVKVCANIVELPLRMPSVLARSTASLDLLSGGRLELGLGADAYWDAIEAIRDFRKSAAQAAAAMSESIEIIRAVWHDGGHGHVFFDGAKYRVDEIEPGPEPAHEMHIWVGARERRMLRVTAEKADGWLASLFRRSEANLVGGNAVIDQAAAAAGRDPREIRRLVNIRGAFSPSRHGFLNGTPADWVEDLLPFAIKHGFATFGLATDDPEQIETYAQEVVPALREAVGRERENAISCQGCSLPRELRNS